MNRIFVGILAVACSCQFASAQVKVVPERADDNLIVAAYNIQWLGHKDYDHIYVGRTGRTRDQLVTGSCNTLDVCHLIYGDNTPANMKKARSELSDHLPVFAVFKTDTPDDD